MTSGLKIPAEVLESAIRGAIQQSLDGIDLRDVKLYRAKEAAAMLKLTQQGFRQIARNRVDFGPQSKRWSLSDLEALIQSRRVKATYKRP
jgi:hypothetical protein